MNTTSTATTIPLDDPAATDVEVAGGKAATLSRLSREGFAVPPGFVVPVTMVQRWLNERGPGGRSTIPDEHRRALASALDALGAGPVAVRSSAVGEDTAEASFAGQYETVLGVEGVDALTDALATVLASAGGARVASYRATRGAGEHGRPRPADGSRGGRGCGVLREPGDRRPRRGPGQCRPGAG